MKKLLYIIIFNIKTIKKHPMTLNITQNGEIKHMLMQVLLFMEARFHH